MIFAFFFFKQKTAYEMRISDWSSDVCSSDLSCFEGYRKEERRMSVSIRLARGGAKKRPYYRIVVANSRAPRDGRFLEKIGTYNPLLAKNEPKRVTLAGDRAKHWRSEERRVGTECVSK